MVGYLEQGNESVWTIKGAEFHENLSGCSSSRTLVKKKPLGYGT
jgi:hypothetical protein